MAKRMVSDRGARGRRNTCRTRHSKRDTRGDVTQKERNRGGGRGRERLRVKKTDMVKRVLSDSGARGRCDIYRI